MSREEPRPNHGPALPGQLGAILVVVIIAGLVGFLLWLGASR